MQTKLNTAFITILSDLLKSCCANVKFLHWSRFHWSTDQCITLVTTYMAVLKDKRILFLLGQSIALLGIQTCKDHTDGKKKAVASG